MNDNEKYVATLIPNEQMKCSGLVERVIKRMTDEIAFGIINLVSDGKEYAIKMLPEQRKEIPDSLGYWSTEIREGISVKELVRCRECVYWDRGTIRMIADNPELIGAICDKYHEYGISEDVWTAADYYCADGERRTDE